VKKTLIAILLALYCPTPVLAQSILGSMTGTIKDPSGQAMAGVRITVTDVATGVMRAVNTNSVGDFLIPNLEPATYRLTASITGFKTFTKENIVLTASETLPLGDLTLQLGSVNQQVTVTAQGATVQTASADKSSLITDTQLDSLLIKSRNIYDMIGILPGIQSERVVTQPTFVFQIYASGNRFYGNDVTLDGISTINRIQDYTTTVDVAMNSVSEVKVLNGNFQAEYGQAAGATIQMVSKSGTKDFHGDASYFLRNEDFNANDFFNNRNGVVRPRYRYNAPSYAIGGTIFIPGHFNKDRNKLFFYWTQEFWPTTNSVLGEYTVPTAAERTGDFSSSVTASGAAITIKDPTLRTPVPGNVVPTAQQNASGLALLKLFPLPNFTNTAISNRQYNYIITQPTITNYVSHTLKIDYNLSPRNMFSVNWSTRSDPRNGYYGEYDVSGNTWPQVDYTEIDQGEALIARYNAIINPSLVNEVSFGITREKIVDGATAASLQANSRSTVGFTVGQINPASNPLSLIPNASFGGVTNPINLNVDYRFPATLIQPQMQLSDTLTKIHGKHTVKAGISIYRLFADETGYSYTNGQLAFGTSSTWPEDTGYAFANAVYGNFQSYEEDAGRPHYYPRINSFEWFAQDTWKVTRRLTLDYGMRFSYMPFPSEKSGDVSGFVPSQWSASSEPELIRPVLSNGVQMGMNPATGAILPAALIGALAPGVGNPYDGMTVPPAHLVNNRPPQLGPRAGFAYDVFGDGKTAIRGGIGISYSQPWGYDVVRTYVNQAPQVTSQTLYYGTLNTLSSAQGYGFPYTIYGMDPNAKIPNTYNYSLSVQREIGYGTVLDVAYGGSQMRHLEYWYANNEVPLGADFLAANKNPATGGVLPANFLTPHQGYGSIYYTQWNGNAHYNSLQVQANRRFTKSLQYGVAWTWSKTMGLDGENADRATMSQLVPRSYYYGLSSVDRTHVFKLNYVWSLPKGSQFMGGNKIAGGFLDNWRLTGITSFETGEPTGLSMTENPTVDITGSASLSPRVNIVGNPVLPKGQRTFAQNFNISAIAEPAVGTYGTAPLYFLRQPGLNNWDIALFKDFPIKERAKLTMRWETYNTFNHPSFTTMNTAAQFNASGTQINSALGQFTADYSPRQMELALVLTF